MAGGLPAPLTHEGLAVPSAVPTDPASTALEPCRRWRARRRVGIAGGGTEGWPWHRRAISRGGNRYASALLGLRVEDATAGFRAFRDTTIRKIDPTSGEASGYGFQVEMAWRTERAGLRIVEVPITFRDRRYGESKMTARIAGEAMWLVTKWGARTRFGGD